MANPTFAFKDLMKKPNLENTFRFLGENENSATLIACSIAVFKGIFRPMFTMMDKNSDPETKKYAAIREGLTEVAALPLYALTPLIAAKLVDKFSKEPNEIVKKRMKGNAKFFGICAATLIIPAVCNVIQPPIMAAYKRSQDSKKANLAEATAPATINKPAFSGRAKAMNPLGAKINSGMRVGN